MNAQEQVFCHYVDPPILNLDTVLVYQNAVQYIKMSTFFTKMCMHIQNDARVNELPV